MLPEPVRALILEEQARQQGRFLPGVDLEVYLAKLGARAEIVAEAGEGRCRGVVAFYCDDAESRRAFISLVLVDPRERGRGLGRTLVTRALDVARSRGCTACALEVTDGNAAAQALYHALGFHPIESRGGRHLLETAL